MRRHLPWVILVAFLSVAAYIGNEQGVNKWNYSRTATITTTASTITMTPPASVPAGNAPRLVRIKSPSSNVDVIRIDSVTAVSTSMPLSPGEVVELPYAKSTISVKSDSGTQAVDITAFYR